MEDMFEAMRELPEAEAEAKKCVRELLEVIRGATYENLPPKLQLAIDNLESADRYLEDVTNAIGIEEDE